MKNILESPWQILVYIFYAIGVGVMVYFPFMEAFALTPLLTFVHRFSVTIPVGADPKTLQIIVFLIPILLAKGLLEYNKRYNIKELWKEPVIWALAVLLVIDSVYTLFTASFSLSLFTLAVRALSYALFFTTSIWVRIIFDGIWKPNLIDVTFKIVRNFLLALGAFALINGLVSFSQFIDCSVINQKCVVWEAIDREIPNRLLPVGHQKFSDEFFLIRTPGFFGDVNLNGMFALMVVLIFAALLVSEMLLARRKGFKSDKRMMWFYLAVIAISLPTFILTLSRSAIIAFAPTALLIFAIVIVRLLQTENMGIFFAKRVAIAVAVIIVGLIAFLGIGTQISLSKSDGQKQTMTNLMFSYVGRVTGSNDSSALTRLILWDNAQKIMQEYNYLGGGLGTFKYTYAKHIDPKSPNTDPHSTYITLLTEVGIIGTVVYLIVLAGIWYSSIRFMFFVRKAIGQILATKEKNHLTKEQYIKVTVLIFLAAFSAGIPFMTIATVTYYGFFLPMTWWWGSTLLVSNRLKEFPKDGK
jgi:O-antigen ligase